MGLESIFGAPNTIAGPAINAATALRVPAVFAATALLAGAVGSLPAKVFLSLPSGKTAASDHPAYRLVHREANDFTSAGQLRTRLTADALLHDHGFALANRADSGRVIEFIRLDPRSVTIKADERTGEPVYEHRVGNVVWRYGYRDILHISAPLDMAPIKAGREAIGLASVLERHAAQLFGGGARPSAVLSKESKTGTDKDEGPNVIVNMKKAWRSWQSNGNANPLVLDGWKYTPATMNSTDAQFLENRRFQTEEIARVFRIPPTMLFDLTRGTWSNTEEMFQTFLTLTLRGWLDAWEWAYARVLLTPEERDEGYYVEFVVDDLLTANAKTRATVYAQYRAMGAMTANEVRAGLNRAPLDGGDTLDNPNITPGAPTPEPDNDNRDADEEAA
jgi:HK97 family phage portal protein